MAIIVRSFTLALVAVLVAAAAALAQETAPGTVVSFTGGAASGTSTTGLGVGGSVLVDLNDWTALEAQGSYFDRGAGADGLNISASLLVNLLSGRRRIVPYAAVGGGLYRASFDLANGRFLGPIGPAFQTGGVYCPANGTGIGPGAGYGPGMMGCPTSPVGYWSVGEMPGFYGRRLGALVIPGDGMWRSRAFTDPALNLGGGIRFNVSERVTVRPDLRALVVFGNGDTYTMAVFGIHVGYRF